ncbi:hypothetical protein [Streptomyces sp. HGB0020]|uniref:hypothetical protein n=1 Tax=Streptomyces sp. HGB0020 TaxID=1078086 RepID=UPI00034EC8F6|nr:hypothetical protein [Streptomyces sp. HGB0020]EPD62395.1 hypothetical protein HMPREF1211_04029 [Streptomyces sp. HGB0020]
MNGRKTKQQRRQEREHSERMAAAIRAAVPVLLRTTPDGNEVWQAGPATVVVPVVPLDAPTEMQQAVTAYRMANLTGRCPHCELHVEVELDGRVFFHHKAVCPAHPDEIKALGERLGIEVTRRT